MPQVSHTPFENVQTFVSNRLSETIRDLENSSRIIDRNVEDSVSYRLEQLIFICSESERIWPEFVPRDVINKIAEAYSAFCQSEKEPCNENCLFSVVKTGSDGRPSFDIPQETLEMYLRYGLTRTKIAEIMGISRKTVTRRIDAFGLSDSLPRYTSIENDTLDSVVQEILRDFPNCGIRRMKGFLSAQGIRLQWLKVRDAMWRVDPSGLLLRTIQLNTIQRRAYYVPGTLALWHLDENHKLIRWGFVIHGCVDGYSRPVMFLHYSTNNKAETVYNLFINAIEEHGLPSRA